MSYVPSFEVDVFISYAHADNSVAGRVTTFHKDLIAELTVRLGARAFRRPEEWVFFDRSGVKLGDEISPKLERAARRSAIMISLISQSYLQASWCIHEAKWFQESRQLARDLIERSLIPVLFNPVDESDLAQFLHLAVDRLRGSLCAGSSPYAPATAEWDRAVENLAKQVVDHLNAARRQHGAVYVGEAYPAAENLRCELMEDLRGFRSIPENAIFSLEELVREEAVRKALAEAKLAVHFLGDTGAEAATSAEAILWSLEHCPGKTVGYLPPGRQLAEDEQQLVAAKRNHPKWTQPECTPTELAQILTRELESFRLPDPATPIALACDEPDLATVRGIAREIHERDRGAFAVTMPDFLAEPGALPFIGWKKLLTRSQSIVVYWGRGQKEYLDTNVNRFLPAAKLGRLWYVSLRGTETERKRQWQPGDPETEVIVDEEQPFRYEQLQPFLKRVRERARK
jgi:hypothetical protein